MFGASSFASWVVSQELIIWVWDSQVQFNDVGTLCPCEPVVWRPKSTSFAIEVGWTALLHITGWDVSWRIIHGTARKPHTAESTSVFFDFGIIGEHRAVGRAIWSATSFVTHVEYLTMGPPNQVGRAEAKCLTLAFVWCAIPAPTSPSCFLSFCHRSIVLALSRFPLLLWMWDGQVLERGSVQEERGKETKEPFFSYQWLQAPSPLCSPFTHHHFSCFPAS